MGACTIPTAHISHFHGSESQHRPIPRSDPQHSLHDHDLVKSTTKLWPRFTWRSPWSEKDQPRNKHCSCPQKGIGVQFMAASRSRVRVTHSQNSKSLNALGCNTDSQNDYESSPWWLSHTASQSPCRNSHESLIQTRIPHIFSMFFQENATCQIIREFWREKLKPLRKNKKTFHHDTLSLTWAQLASQERIQKQKKATRLANSLSNSSSLRKQQFWVQKCQIEFN